MNVAPIVLFTYNRLDHTKETIKALQANHLAAESSLYIYSDAAKNSAAEPAVEAVRAYLKTVSGFKEIHIIERDRNWGLADSIVDGVTHIVNTYGRVIVLEDDIVTSPFFLQYMNDALELYKDDTAVMHISGYFFPVDTTDLPDTFFYNQTSCWGWATWDRAWAQGNFTAVDEQIQYLTTIKNPPYYIKSCLSQLAANKRGEIKTWAAKWQASVTMAGGLCLHPAESLVANIGHDGSGVHSQKQAVSLNRNMIRQVPLPVHTIEQIEHPFALARANTFYKKLVPNPTKRLLQYVKRILAS